MVCLAALRKLPTIVALFFESTFCWRLRYWLSIFRVLLPLVFGKYPFFIGFESTLYLFLRSFFEQNQGRSTSFYSVSYTLWKLADRRVDPSKLNSMILFVVDIGSEFRSSPTLSYSIISDTVTLYYGYIFVVFDQTILVCSLSTYHLMMVLLTFNKCFCVHLSCSYRMSIKVSASQLYSCYDLFLLRCPIVCPIMFHFFLAVLESCHLNSVGIPWLQIVHQHSSIELRSTYFYCGL